MIKEYDFARGYGHFDARLIINGHIINWFGALKIQKDVYQLEGIAPLEPESIKLGLLFKEELVVSEVLIPKYFPDIKDNTEYELFDIEVSEDDWTVFRAKLRPKRGWSKQKINSCLKSLRESSKAGIEQLRRIRYPKSKQRIGL